MKSLMRVLGLFVILFTLSGLLFADTLKVDAVHSTVGFTIRHMFSQVHGRFTQFSGTILYDSAAPEKFSIEMEIQTNSISTDNPKRDGHLRSEDFFWADSFPVAAFKSTKAYKSESGAMVEGNLVIRGVTKEVKVPFEILGSGKTGGRLVAAFHATFKVSRKDFGILWNRDVDFGGTLLGDDVTITIDLESGTEKKSR